MFLEKQTSARTRKSRRWQTVFAALIATVLVLCTLAACAADESPATPDAPNPTVEQKSGESGTVADGYATSESGTELGDSWMGELYPGDAPFNTEEYSHIDERGFALAKLSPLSTVSADVDTASFANLRRMLRDGYNLDEIPTGAIRIEEVLNYLDYDYPAPEGDDKFSISAAVGDCPWNPDTKLLVLGFASAPETAPRETGSNLVFLVDVSGSMDSPDKLDLLKESFDVLCDGLTERDSVSIVTYAAGEELVCEAVPGNDKRQIMRAIRRLQANGSTNGERGLELAYEVAERNYIEGGVNRIVMASDGDLNVGMSSESELHDYVEKKRESGIYLSVLGFGSGNIKDNKMEVLADHGNGSYHYIDCVDEAERVLSQRIMANLVPFADDVKVQVEFNPAEVKGYRLLGYENREMAAEDFTDDTKDAGDVGPGAQFTVAYELVLADSAMDLSQLELKYKDSSAAEGSTAHAGEWLTAKLRYRAFQDGQVHQQERVVGADDLSTNPGNDWHQAAAAIELALCLRDSAWRGEATLDDALAQLELGTRDDYSTEALRELIELASEATGIEELDD